MSAISRTAIVTGAARGVGRVIATTLAREGYALVLVDIAAAYATEAEARSLGSEVLAVQADITSEAAVAELGKVARERFGEVNVVVNNAGISLLVAAEQTTAHEWRRVLDVNLTGPFLLSREFGTDMLKAGTGAIVNIASIAGIRGVSHRAAYNASKHGLIGLTSTLAAEWGGRGVRVNAVCPGWIKTEMDVEDQASGAYSDADIENQVPLARFATPQDIANAVVFLADSERSGFINGVALSVDGGWATDASWTSLRLSTR